MIWYICFLIVVVLIFRAAFVLVNNRRRFKSVRAFFYVLLASFIIYLPVLSLEFSMSGALLGSALNVMRMVTLDANFLDFYSLIHKSTGIEIFSNLYILVIGLLHIIVPIFAIKTAYDCIVKFISNLRVSIINNQSKDIYVFSEINDDSINLALDISKNSKKRSDFIFANTSDNYEKYSYLFRKLNFCTVVSDEIDGIDLKIKKNRKIYFYNISKDSNDNINRTLKLVEKYIKFDRVKQRQIDIFLFSNLPETATIVDSIEKGVLGIHLIDYVRTSIYKLFDEHPLFECIDKKRISLLICGLNAVGLEALKAALWLGQIEGIELIINVIDINAMKKKAQLELQCPEMFLDEYNIKFHQADITDISLEKVLREYCGDTTYSVVAGEDDEKNISTALYLRRFFLKKDLSVKKMPIVATYINNSEKAKVVSNLKTPESKEERKVNYNIIPFGGANSIYTYDTIMNSSIENLSVNVHLAYEEIFSNSEIINIFEALERYNAFEVNKNSNRANALHIRYKLWMLGLDYSDDEKAREIDFKEYLTNEILEKLTVAEHDRWMAFLRTEGWTTATISDVEKYKKTDLSKGRHNCPLLLMHPYLCNFNELQDVSDKLGLPDATVYDRDLIRMIPQILKNSAVNSCNYKIIKRGNL